MIFDSLVYAYSFIYKNYWLILKREKGGERQVEREREKHLISGKEKGERQVDGKRERETLIYCSNYLCIHLLLLACALTGDQTYHSLGVSGQHSHQLNYPPGPIICFFNGKSIKIRKWKIRKQYLITLPWDAYLIMALLALNNSQKILPVFVFMFAFKKIKQKKLWNWNFLPVYLILTIPLIEQC